MEENIISIPINSKESLDDSDSNTSNSYIQLLKHIPPKSDNVNYNIENINSYSTDYKIIQKKPDIKISYIGDIKNEFGIYSNRLSKIEKEAESYAKLEKQIQLIKQMKFENQTLRKIKNNIRLEYLPHFDIKDCFIEKNKILFKKNRPILLSVEKKVDTECKLSKINRKYLTYLINFNKKHKNKYFTANIFDNMNKINKNKLKKSTRNCRKIRNNTDMNYANNGSFFNKKYSLMDNNSNNLVNTMLQIKKITESELSKIHYGLQGNLFKKSFNENKGSYSKDFSLKKNFGLNSSPKNKNKYHLYGTTSRKNGKEEKICLKIKNKFNINRVRYFNKELIKNQIRFNIDRKNINKDISDPKKLSYYKHYDSSFVKSNEKK